MKNTIHIFDTTLRDGEQSPGCQLSPDEKLTVAKELDLLNVDIIELGFPCSSPADFLSVQNISKEVKRPILCALSRAVESDISTAAEALKYAVRPRIHTGIGTSDSHIKYKFKCSKEQIIKRAVAAVKYAKSFVEDVEFYAEDAGRTENEFLAKVLEEVIKAGATVLNIPDTTGYCLPEQYGEKIKYIYENVSGIHNAVISSHCHNDLGLATANSLAGIQNGARQVECTINGIGERAGNTSLEEIVMVMNQHNNLGLNHNIDTTRLNRISKMVEAFMNMPIQANKAIVGKNAFSHSSGIHQDGVIKNRCTYEIIDPKDVGANDSAIILTARSGRAALKFKANDLGVVLENKDVDQIYPRFLNLADEVKLVSDEILMEFLNEVMV